MQAALCAAASGAVEPACRHSSWLLVLHAGQWLRTGAAWWQRARRALPGGQQCLPSAQAPPWTLPGCRSGWAYRCAWSMHTPQGLFINLPLGSACACVFGSLNLKRTRMQVDTRQHDQAAERAADLCLRSRPTRKTRSGLPSMTSMRLCRCSCLSRSSCRGHSRVMHHTA